MWLKSILFILNFDWVVACMEFTKPCIILLSCTFFKKIVRMNVLY